MKQPESLRLAKLCDAEQLRTVRHDIFMHDAAKEFRRLQAEVERLNVALQAAIRAGVGAAPEGWQTIETAPKDGADVLLRSKHGRVADGAWGQPSGWANPNCWVWPYINQEPTHWMPLPAAPKP